MLNAVPFSGQSSSLQYIDTMFVFFFLIYLIKLIFIIMLFFILFSASGHCFESV